jgi:hypothetical protein
MKNWMMRQPAWLAVAALAAFAPLAGAQANATSGGAAEDSAALPNDSGAVVNGTIPAAPPGLPEQAPSGAQGPARADTGLASDPSVRDTDPQTVNGLWEMHPGNRVTRSTPNAQAQQQQQ